MTEYFSPGVYIQEVENGPQPIEGVSTSIAGAVGVTVRGPTAGVPVLLTSFLDFQRTFGGFLPQPTSDQVTNYAGTAKANGRWWTFPLGVKGFFDNGGQQLYVKRVVSSTIVTANVALTEGVVSHVIKNAASGEATITVEHLVGIDTTTPVHLVICQGDTGTQIYSGAVKSYQPGMSSSQITLTPTLGVPLVAARNDYVQVVTPAMPVTSVTFNAVSGGFWGNDLQVLVAPSTTSYRLVYDPTLGDQQATGKLKAPALHGTTSIALDATSVAGTFATDSTGVGRLVINNNDAYDFTNVVTSGGTTTITLKAGESLSMDYATGLAVVQLRRSAAVGGTTVQVLNASEIYPNAIIEIDNGQIKYRSTVKSVAGSTVTFVAPPAPTVAYYEGQMLRVIEAEVSVEYAPGGVVQTVETFDGLRLFDDGSPSYFATAINNGSQLVRVVVGALSNSADLSTFPLSPALGKAWTPLGGGDDQNGTLGYNDFIGVDNGPGNRTGIQSFLDITDLSIITVPGMWDQQIQSALIQQCETLLDRFAILDSPRLPDPLPPNDIGTVQTFREYYNTEYAALYYPWLQVNDPSVSQTVLAPPSGHMAGIYARVDTSRGVWKAPANVVINGIVQLDQLINQSEQDLLNPAPTNINVLRFFPNQGNLVWGARVITSDEEWKYINVRRLFIYLESSLKQGTQWAVFEPNDEPLWARMRATVTNFLTTTWRQGALQGATAAEAFFVRCDRTTMTQDDIDNGRLIIIVGVAPVMPAEFVIFQIQQYTASSSS